MVAKYRFLDYLKQHKNILSIFVSLSLISYFYNYRGLYLFFILLGVLDYICFYYVCIGVCTNNKVICKEYVDIENEYGNIHYFSSGDRCIVLETNLVSPTLPLHIISKTTKEIFLNNIEIGQPRIRIPPNCAFQVEIDGPGYSLSVTINKDGKKEYFKNTFTREEYEASFTEFQAIKLKILSKHGVIFIVRDYIQIINSNYHLLNVISFFFMLLKEYKKQQPSIYENYTFENQTNDYNLYKLK